VRACRPKGGAATGPTPTARGKAGSKRHLVVGRGGIPLVVTRSAANVPGSTRLEATLDAIPPGERLAGRQRRAVERALARLSRFRRLTVRYERRADLHRAFLTLGCSLICWRAAER